MIPAFIQPGRYGADPGMAPFPHDPQAAKAVLEKAGLAGRELIFVSSPAWKGVVEAIGRNLSEIGLSARFVSDRGDLPEAFDVKLEWYFDWTPQYPVACVHREFFGVTPPCVRARRIRRSMPSTTSSCTPPIRRRRRAW